MCYQQCQKHLIMGQMCVTWPKKNKQLIYENTCNFVPQAIVFGFCLFLCFAAYLKSVFSKRSIGLFAMTCDLFLLNMQRFQVFFFLVRNLNKCLELISTKQGLWEWCKRHIMIKIHKKRPLKRENIIWEICYLKKTFRGTDYSVFNTLEMYSFFIDNSQQIFYIPFS